MHRSIHLITALAILYFYPVIALSDYTVGFSRLEVTSTDTHEKVPLALVYPSITPPETVNFGPFQMKLAIGGIVAEGNFPLVIISHGSGGSHLGHRSIAFDLVKKGFIVGMPLHPKNNYDDNSAEGTASNWQNRQAKQATLRKRRNRRRNRRRISSSGEIQRQRNCSLRLSNPAECSSRKTKFHHRKCGSTSRPTRLTNPSRTFSSRVAFVTIGSW